MATAEAALHPFSAEALKRKKKKEMPKISFRFKLAVDLVRDRISPNLADRIEVTAQKLGFDTLSERARSIDTNMRLDLEQNHSATVRKAEKLFTRVKSKVEARITELKLARKIKEATRTGKTDKIAAKQLAVIVESTIATLKKADPVIIGYLNILRETSAKWLGSLEDPYFEMMTNPAVFKLRDIAAGSGNAKEIRAAQEVLKQLYAHAATAFVTSVSAQTPLESEALLRSATRLSLLDVAAHKLTNIKDLSAKEISNYLSLIYEIAASGDLEALRGLVNAPTISQDVNIFLEDIKHLRDQIVAARGVGPSGRRSRRSPRRTATHIAPPPETSPPARGPEPEEPTPEEDVEEVSKGVRSAAKKVFTWYKKWRLKKRESIAAGYVARIALPGEIELAGYERIPIPKNIILNAPTGALADASSSIQYWFFPKSCLLRHQPLEVLDDTVKKAVDLGGILGGLIEENLGAFFGETTSGNEALGIAANVAIAALFAHFSRELQLPFLEGATSGRMATTALVFRVAKLIEAYFNPERSWLGPPANVIQEAKQFEIKGGRPGLILCAPNNQPIIREDTGEPLTISGTFMFERMWTPFKPSTPTNFIQRVLSPIQRLVGPLTHLSTNIFPGGHKIFVTSLQMKYYFRTIPVLPFDSARGKRPWHKTLPVFLQDVIRENINKTTLKLIPFAFVGMALLNIDRVMNTLGIPMTDRIAAIDFLGSLLIYPYFIPVVIGAGLYSKYRQIRYGLPAGYEAVKDILSQIVQWPKAVLEGDPAAAKAIVDKGGLPGMELPHGNFSTVKEAITHIVGEARGAINNAHVALTEGGEATRAYFWYDPTATAADPQCLYAAPEVIPEYEGFCKHVQGVFERVIELKTGN
jgi:hypothetical protein